MKNKMCCDLFAVKSMQIIQSFHNMSLKIRHVFCFVSLSDLLHRLSGQCGVPFRDYNIVVEVKIMRHQTETA